MPKKKKKNTRRASCDLPEAFSQACKSLGYLAGCKSKESMILTRINGSWRTNSYSCSVRSLATPLRPSMHLKANPEGWLAKRITPLAVVLPSKFVSCFRSTNGRSKFDLRAVSSSFSVFVSKLAGNTSSTGRWKECVSGVLTHSKMASPRQQKNCLCCAAKASCILISPYQCI